MHPRALTYHPARTDYNCAPLYNEVIYTHEKAQQVPISEIFRGWPPPSSEEQIRGARNLHAGSMVESLIAKKIADFRAGISEDSSEAATYAQEFSFLLGDIRDYREAGENIFHLQPAIIDLFRHSELGDAQVERVKLPFASFYLHFGEPARIAVGPHHRWDGAYISDVQARPNKPRAGLTEALGVRLVSREANNRYETRREPIAYLLADPTYSTYLNFGSDKSIAEAIHDALAELPKSEEYRFIPGFPESWPAETVERALQLVANALLFLGSEHVEVAHRYPHEAPANLVRKENAGEGENQRRRAASKLWSLGFKKVHFVGDMIEREASELRQRGGLLEAHWRRGHWRSQPHGPANALRKAIWIRPTIVRPDLGDPHAKRIYDVPKPDPPGNVTE